MRDIDVVTSFLLRRREDSPPAGSGQAEVLLLRRSERVGTYRGRWACISGYLEARSPIAQAYREMAEEIGLGRDDVRLLMQGEPLVVPDENIDTRWTVHPFLFELVRPARVRLDWEHTEYRWVRSHEISTLETVPGLAEAFSRVSGDSWGSAIETPHQL